MHRLLLLVIALITVSLLAAPRLRASASTAPAKRVCKTVVKKVHGHKKRVKVCRTVAPKPTPKPTKVTPKATPSPQATPTAVRRVGPKTYYLALGDSLAFGYQPNLDISHGYADDFYTDLKSHGTSHYVNMACPGESTTTFIHGGCPYAFIVKTSYSGSQLGAALQFIRQHAGQVSPVTLDIGANDFPALTSASCTTIPNDTAQLAAFDTNFNSILSQLQSALSGTGDLLVMNYYDPVQNSCSDPRFLAAVQTLDAHIAADAGRYNVPVADVFTEFGGAVVPNPHICQYTWMCSSSRDVHATSQGYAVIARTFEQAAGY